MNRVLIVDDTVFMRQVLRGILQKHDYEIVAETRSGKVAVELYRDLQPDIVTMEINIPEMDGMNALKEILAFDPSAKVMMISSMSQDIIVKEAFIQGAKSFVVKPFYPSEILRHLTKMNNH